MTDLPDRSVRPAEKDDVVGLSSDGLDSRKRRYLRELSTARTFDQQWAVAFRRNQVVYERILEHERDVRQLARVRYTAPGPLSGARIELLERRPNALRSLLRLEATVVEEVDDLTHAECAYRRH